MNLSGRSGMFALASQIEQLNNVFWTMTQFELHGQMMTDADLDAFYPAAAAAGEVLERAALAALAEQCSCLDEGRWTQDKADQRWTCAKLRRALSELQEMVLGRDVRHDS